MHDWCENKDSSIQDLLICMQQKNDFTTKCPSTEVFLHVTFDNASSSQDKKKDQALIQNDTKY